MKGLSTIDNYSLSDVAAVTRNNDCDGWGGGGGGWIMIILFALIFGGGGFFGGNRNAGGQPVTEAGLCDAMNFNNLENAVGRISDNQAAIARQTDNAICTIGYQALQNTSNIQSQLADCCCTTQRAIDSVRFDMANYSAATNAAITAGTQKVLDKMCADQAAALQDRVQQLELQSALCGVVRYPTATTFAAQNPFCCNTGCGCNV